MEGCNLLLPTENKIQNLFLLLTKHAAILLHFVTTGKNQTQMGG